MFMNAKSKKMKGFAILFFFIVNLGLSLSAYCCSFSPKTDVTFIAEQDNIFTWTGSCNKGDLCEFSFHDCKDKPSWLKFTASKGTCSLSGTPPASAVGFKSCSGNKAWEIYYAQQYFNECWYFFNFSVVAAPSAAVPEPQSLGVTQSKVADPQTRSGKSYTNTVTWDAPNLPVGAPSIVMYLIYRDRSLSEQIGVVSNHGETSFEFKQPNVKRHRTERYYIVAVNELSETSLPTHIKMKRTPRVHKRKKCSF